MGSRYGFLNKAIFLVLTISFNVDRREIGNNFMEWSTDRVNVIPLILHDGELLDTVKLKRLSMIKSYD